MLLRRAGRSFGSGDLTINAAPAVIARLEQNADWLQALRERAGRTTLLRAEPGLAISAGHVQSAFQ
jgi:hypothetical protein